MEDYKYRHRHAWFAIDGDAGDDPRVELHVQLTRMEAAALIHVINLGIRSEEAGEERHIARVYRDFIDQAGKTIPAKR